MISMTAYWQQFKECLDSLQISTKDKEYSLQIETAKNLIEIGLSIETLGITEIKQVVNQLSEKAKLFGHIVSYTEEEHQHKFHLPKISNNETLIFAIIYYQHLLNYQNVNYQGSINWFRQKVIDGINEKKITTAIQAKALLQEIQNYCQTQNIVANESSFLKSDEESVKDYTARITKTFTKQSESPKAETETKATNQSDEIADLEKSLEKLKHQSKKIKEKTDAIEQKLATYNKAKQNLLKLTAEWQNQWLITRVFYKFISFFYEASIIKKLKTAQEQLLKAEVELKKELLPHAPEFYIEKLRNHQQKLMREQLKIQSEITQKKEAPQVKAKEDKTSTVKPHSTTLSSPNASPKSEEEEEDSLEAASNNDYYGFFKRHLPGRYAIEAIAVGVAAIAIQNLL